MWTTARTLIAGALGGIAATLALQLVAPQLGTRSVEMLVEEPSDQAQFNAAIESYLMADPAILERMSEKLQSQRDAQKNAETKQAIGELWNMIVEGNAAVSVGNPKGDVTLVELYDYNCGYCRRTLPDVVALLEEDPDVRLVLRQLPILSQGSLDAAKVGIAVAKEGADYWAFHQALFTARGQIDLDAALAAASSVGLDSNLLRTRANEDYVQEAIAESFTIAQRLGIDGTPSFILGDEVIPGAVGLDVLREKIRNVRSCGSTRCQP